MLKIGDFSKLSRVSIRMLRHYDEIGLLIPEFTDPFTGYRHYGEAQLTAANRITALRDMGFGLVAIAELMRRSEDTEAFRQGLLRQKEETLQEAENTTRGATSGYSPRTAGKGQCNELYSNVKRNSKTVCGKRPKSDSLL